LDDVRFDPVWRRIRRDSYTKKLEGRFPERFIRLEQLVNWGALSWLNRHATATKQAHHLGTEHNAARFLASGERRLQHRPSLRAAAHVMHWGHPPLSYQSAEAILRAAHVESKTRETLEAVVNQVVSFGLLECAEEDHPGRCVGMMLDGERPFELYRWFSAWIVSEEWSRLWSAICEAELALGAEAPDETKAKSNLLKSLVCHDYRGHAVLTACNRADYVPRDLLQCGTAWLTLDPDVLWEQDPIGPEAADEWALIDSARAYLEQRFYATPSSMLMHTLTARLIANDFARTPVSLDALRALLIEGEGDAYFERHLRPKYRKTLCSLKKDGHRDFETDWAEVGTFRQVSLPQGSRFGAEDFLTGRTGKRRVIYPFVDAYSVFVEFPKDNAFTAHMAGQDRRYGDVYCHQRRSKKPQKLRPMLDVLAKTSSWIQRNHAGDVESAILSWIVGSSVEQRSTALFASCQAIAVEDMDLIRSGLRRLRGRPSLTEFNEHNDAVLRAELLADTAFAQPVQNVGEFLLRMPWKAIKISDGQAMLRQIGTKALAKAREGKGGDRGPSLELAVAVDQLLKEDECVHRFAIFNATELSQDRRAMREWDVIRLDLLREGGWTLTAIECSVNRSKKKDDKDVLALQALQDAIRNRYSDLVSYTTLFATVGDGGLEYEDAGRSYTP
jgi:hypothetical protein